MSRGPSKAFKLTSRPQRSLSHGFRCEPPQCCTLLWRQWPICCLPYCCRFRPQPWSLCRCTIWPTHWMALRQPGRCANVRAHLWPRCSLGVLSATRFSAGVGSQGGFRAEQAGNRIFLPIRGACAAQKGLSPDECLATGALSAGADPAAVAAAVAALPSCPHLVNTGTPGYPAAPGSAGSAEQCPGGEAAQHRRQLQQCCMPLAPWCTP